MSSGKYYVFSIGTIVAGILILVAVWRYGQSLTEGLAIQRFSASVTAVAAVSGFLAFVVLVFYTIETRLLRKATEQQLEGGIRPVLVFEISSADHKLGGAMNLTTFHVKNIGPGPAFDVTVSPIIGDAVRLDVGAIPLIESKDMKIFDWSVAQNGQRSGMSRRPALLTHLFAEGKFPDRTPVTLECRGLSGKRYRTFHELRYDSVERRLWTEFVRSGG